VRVSELIGVLLLAKPDDDYDRWLKTGDLGPAGPTHRHSSSCSVEDCDKIARTRGWCPRHYNQWRRTGNPVSVEWTDPLTEDDYEALHASVAADAWRLLPLTVGAIVLQMQPA
jgi:hypothetical protein